MVQVFNYWSGLSLMWRVVALSAEVEDMQKTHGDHSVKHSINLIKTKLVAWLQPHLVTSTLSYHQFAKDANRTQQHEVSG